MAEFGKNSAAHDCARVRDLPRFEAKGDQPSAWSAPPHRRVGKLTPRGTNCSFFDGWRARRLQRFCWGSAPMSWRDCVYNGLFMNSLASNMLAQPAEPSASN